MKSITLVPVLLALACAARAGAADQPAAAPQAEQARIAFANHGGIYDWQVVNDTTLLIESQSFKWYKATLMAPCFNLPFAQRVGFQSNPDGSFDKFSAIEVDHQRCQVISLVPAAAPGKRVKHAKPDAAGQGSPASGEGSPSSAP